ncbi:MAG TPA: lysophospholipid acyltransferase family protein [Pirellulaceae bacterium]|nr:lysophospholipid acyltransferase family protein [Pirellulaceae bacterium]
MKRRDRWLIPFIAAAVAFVIRLWMSTMRVRMVSADGRRHPADPKQNRYIYSFWHEGLLAPLATNPKIRVLISQHTDGEVIAQICQRLGIGVIRGSTARGGCQALLEMIRDRDETTHLGITPDGPRGPRRVLKPGVVMIASQSGLAIVPAGIGFVKAWRFGSWDRFALPCPGSMMVGVVGQPISVPRNLDRGSLQQWVLFVEGKMLELTRLAEDWAERIRQQGRTAALPSFPDTALRQSA